MRRQVSDLKLPFGEKDFVAARIWTALYFTAGLNNSLKIDSKCNGAILAFDRNVSCHLVLIMA